MLIFLLFITQKCLQCFDAVSWAAGRAPFIQSGFVLLPKSTWPVKTESWGAGTVICLEQGADLHTAQLMPLPLTVSCSSKIQIGFTFLDRLTQVVPDKGPLSGCVLLHRNILLNVYHFLKTNIRHSNIKLFNY